MNINEVIKYPILTEKTYAQMPNNIYTFAVNLKTNQTEVKKAIEFIFQVKVAKVNIINVGKKPKKLGKFKGFTSKIKKAIVFLEEGKINLYPDEVIKDTPKPVPDEIKKTINEETKKPIDQNQEKIILDVEKRVAEKIAAKKEIKKTITNISKEKNEEQEKLNPKLKKESKIKKLDKKKE